MNNKIVKLLSIVSVFFLSACSSSYDKPATVAETAAASRSVQVLNNAQYTNTATAHNAAFQTQKALIAIQDTLDINVFKVPDLSAKKLIVEPNGAISLPFVGTVKVAGLSLIQAEQKITQKLKSFMQDPKVSITRTDKAVLKRVTVEGEVKTPGVFPIKGNLSFLQAIAMAQGLSEIADSRNILFYRDGAQHRINLDLVRKGQIQDPVLRSDDRIVVLQDEAKVRERKVKDYLPTVLAPISVLGGFLN